MLLSSLQPHILRLLRRLHDESSRHFITATWLRSVLFPYRQILEAFASGVMITLRLATPLAN